MKRVLYSLWLALCMYDWGSLAWALPENSLNVRSSENTIQQIVRIRAANTEASGQLKNELSASGIAVLDELWNQREDIRSGECSATRNDCRVLSVFRGTSNEHPLVLLTGFTGYRRMYMEQIYDLLQAGYGPIYISDFAGGGESYKPQLQPGQSLPTVAEFLQNSSKSVREKFHKRLQSIAGDQSAALLPILNRLPIGLGHIQRFSDYVADINFVMQIAAQQNPEHKLLVNSLSMGGMVMLMALAQPPQEQTWIARIDRLVFESPMIRVKHTGPFGIAADIIATLLRQFKGSTQTFNPKHALPEFLDKALARYNPENSISHSAKRLAMTDSIRVWNGFETAGATFGWAVAELHAQFSEGPLGTTGRGLNRRLKAIRDAINNNGIKVIVVGTEADQVVDIKATKSFVKRLGREGVQNAWLCMFQTSRHVIDQEADKYREPYMALLADQLRQNISASYGVEPQHELLRCAAVTH